MSEPSLLVNYYMAIVYYANIELISCRRKPPEVLKTFMF